MSMAPLAAALSAALQFLARTTRKMLGAATAVAVLVSAAAWIGPPRAEGAPITWSSGPSFKGANGFQAIDTTGTLVEAVNLSDAGPLVVDPGGLNITFQPGNKLNQGFYNSGSPGSTDANWNSVVDRTDWNNNNATFGTFLTGLTPGYHYQVQLFASDSRGCCSGRAQIFTDGLGHASPAVVTGSFTSTIGRFTADSATQAIGLTNTSTDPVLNAYVLRQTASPPPALPAGGVVTPIFAGGTPPSYGSPTSLVDGTGMPGGAPLTNQAHETIHTKGWLINNTNSANELVFTMPRPADLNAMHAWQYSQGTCCTGRGVSTFDLQFSTDGGATYSAPMALGPLNAASGTAQEYAQRVDFPEQTGVTHVKITNMADFPALSNPGWQGLNEVHFQGTVAPSTPGHFGNSTLPGRASASDGNPQVLWSNMYGAPVAGTIDSVDIAYQGSGNTFELFQLRPTGAANQFDVIASSGVVTPSGTPNTTVALALPNALDLQPGDMLFHYGRGIPYSDNLYTPDANTQNIYYPSASAPTVGGSLTLGAGGFPLSAIRRDYGWATNLTGLVETVGNGAGPGAEVQPDTASSVLVVMDTDPFTRPGQLNTWQFFNDTPNTGGRLITPVLARDTGGVVEILGIGTTRIGTTDGFQQYDFGLVEGTDLVAPGDLFGFFYGDSQRGNAGSVEFTQAGSNFIRLYTQNLGDGLQMTDSFTSPNWTLSRFYSINASTGPLPEIPEPATLLLTALACLGAGAAVRRRKRT